MLHEIEEKLSDSLEVPALKKSEVQYYSAKPIENSEKKIGKIVGKTVGKMTGNLIKDTSG